MRTINQVFHDNITKICEERGMTINRFCEESGIARSSYHKYGTNEQTATLDTVEKASCVLGVTADVMIKED